MSMPSHPLLLASVAGFALVTAVPATAGTALKEITPNCVATPLPTTSCST